MTRLLVYELFVHISVDLRSGSSSSTSIPDTCARESEHKIADESQLPATTITLFGVVMINFDVCGFLWGDDLCVWKRSLYETTYSWLLSRVPRLTSILGIGEKSLAQKDAAD